MVHRISGRFERILIIKPSSFGDVIHALPVLSGLRRRFPQAHIGWLVADACAGLLENHPALNEIIRFDRKRYGQVGRNLRISMAFMEFVRVLRAKRFDLVVDLQGLFRSGFLAFASGAATRIGFARAREFAPLFYTHRVTTRDADMHAVDRNYLFGQILGFGDAPLVFDLPVLPEARRRMRETLAARGVGETEPYVLIGPGTRWETEVWPAEHFAELARRIAGETSNRIVLIGMPSETGITSRVEALAKGRLVNLAGQTSLPELIALVEGAAAVVMHDSGPMHLATALDKPMVALYGPTSPRRTGPYRRPEAVMRLDLPCSPCYFKKLSQCPYEHRCLRELSPAMVFERLSQILSKPARALS